MVQEGEEGSRQKTTLTRLDLPFAKQLAKAHIGTGSQSLLHLPQLPLSCVRLCRRRCRSLHQPSALEQLIHFHLCDVVCLSLLPGLGLATQVAERLLQLL